MITHYLYIQNIYKKYTYIILFIIIISTNLFYVDLNKSGLEFEVHPNNAQLKLDLMLKVLLMS